MIKSKQSTQLNEWHMQRELALYVEPVGESLEEGG
jgi:hypothetical protein